MAMLNRGRKLKLKAVQWPFKYRRIGAGTRTLVTKTVFERGIFRLVNELKCDCLEEGGGVEQSPISTQADDQVDAVGDIIVA